MTDENAASGYDASFLLIHVPRPGAGGAAQARLLDYPHFSVVLDVGRRLAAVTAVNVDGASLVDLPRRGEWRLDPRVPADAQTGPAVYADNDFDRGHLVRRRDPGWGAPPVADAAMAATFVYPNAAPQASAFNQSKDLWLGLEDHVLAYAQANAHRISVFTAPVLAADDPPYRGIRIPVRFWKVVAWATGDEPRLAAAGFLLDQSDLIDTTGGAVGVAPLGGYRTFQVPLHDIEAIARVDLGPLVAADVQAAAPVGARREWTPLEAAQDIRLD